MCEKLYLLVMNRAGLIQALKPATEVISEKDLSPAGKASLQKLEEKPFYTTSEGKTLVINTKVLGKENLEGTSFNDKIRATLKDHPEIQEIRILGSDYAISREIFLDKLEKEAPTVREFLRAVVNRYGERKINYLLNDSSSFTSSKSWDWALKFANELRSLGSLEGVTPPLKALDQFFSKSLQAATTKEEFSQRLKQLAAAKYLLEFLAIANRPQPIEPADFALISQFPLRHLDISKSYTFSLGTFQKS